MFKKLMSNENGTPSLTNSILMIFVFITAFKTLFAGVVLDFKYFDWKIEGLDLSSTMPLLFSITNYGHKRMTLAQANTVQTDKENE